MSDSVTPCTVCSLPDSSVPGISQARILEGVAISFSSGSSWPPGIKPAFSCIGKRILYHWTTWEGPSLGVNYFSLPILPPPPFQRTHISWCHIYFFKVMCLLYLNSDIGIFLMAEYQFFSLKLHFLLTRELKYFCTWIFCGPEIW